MNRQRLLPHPTLSILLLLVWLLLTNSVGAGQILLGALLGWGLPLSLRHLLPSGIHPRKGIALLRLLGRVLSDIAIANVEVAMQVLGPTARLRPAFIELPLDLQEDFTIAVLASAISLAPGALSADLSTDRRSLLIHALHVDDPQALIARIKQRYEQPLLEIFEC
jgi:multicomponent K+:H+ antiporter subunit E